MKKTLLPILFILCSMPAFAQQFINSSLVLSNVEEHAYKYLGGQYDRQVDLTKIHEAHKTSTAPDTRWFDYTDYLSNEYPGSVFSFAIYLWNDTLSTDIYGDGAGGSVLSHNTMVSVGTVIDPNFGSDDNTGFNDIGYYPLADYLHVMPTNAYEVDSIEIFGFYGINTSKTSVVDTIKIGYTNGAGAVTSTPTDGVFTSYFTNTVVLARYGLTPGADSLFFSDIVYDSVANVVGGVGPHMQYFTIASGAASTNTTAGWYDTIANGVFHKVIGLNPPMSVPAGNKVGINLTFKSGDGSYVTDDTVFTGHTPGTYRYNMFRPLIGFMGTNATTPVFATYSRKDRNVGLFKNLPNFKNGWINRYVPTWAWSATGGAASTYQFPIINMKVKCPTCVTGVKEIANHINKVVCYPNPASDVLNINFDLVQSNNVKVSLSNILGQQVLTKNMDNVDKGKVVFNTSALPNGIYIYTVQTNGVNATGKVVIAH